MGTSLSEAQPVDSREMSQASQAVESSWVHQHGRPVSMGFDPEFYKAEFLAMLKRNGILPKPRPARRHNKMGRVERKHRTIKLILSKLVHAYTHASDVWIVKFAIFLANFMYGNQLVSAFELARGHTPSLTSTELLKVPQEIIEAHKVIVAQ